MKVPAITTIAFSFVGLTAIILFAIGTPSSRLAPPPVAPAAPRPPSISAGGFTLTSTTVNLPLDDTQYPDGPNVDVINANCTSCHSASMALNQPALSQDQWKAEVTKMRKTYKAPVTEQDINAIVAYLTAMSAKLSGNSQTVPANGNASSDRSASASVG